MRLKRRSILAAVLLSMALVVVASLALPAAALALPPDETPAPMGTAEKATAVDLGEIFDLSSQSQLAVAPSQALSSDRFGYTWDDGQLLSWVDAASAGTPIEFTNADDSYSGPIDIGFPFKFYENTFTQLYASTNGLITFGSGSTAFANDRMPQDALPNDFIAPFWDDLAVGGTYNFGKVFYQSGVNAQGRFLAIEWQQVTRRIHQSGEELTFEALLYENGDIWIQYQTVGGAVDEVAVGIEDGNGIDGLLYRYRSPGLSSGDTLRIIRPAASPRVKILPAYQSSFTTRGQAVFLLAVSNAGDSGEDSYALSATSSQANWSFSFYQSDQATPLGDTDQDGAPDSGPISPGASAGFAVQCRAPAEARAGDYTLLTIEARSSLDPSRKTNAAIQCAVPAPFVQGFTDNQLGVRLGLIDTGLYSIANVQDQFPGSAMAMVANNAQGNYIYLWEKTTPQPVLHSDIEYALLDRRGKALTPALKLTDNQAASQRVNERSPSVLAAPDGRTGILWIHDIYDASANQNSNLYFAILDSSGGLFFGPVNVTGNSEWFGQPGADAPLYRTPRLAATSDHRFVLAWDELHNPDGNLSADIVRAVYSTGGSLLKSPAPLTSSRQQGLLFSDPALCELAGNQVLIAYTALNPDPENKTFQIRYSVADSSGALVIAETGLAGGAGFGADAVRLEDGNILLAWIDAESKVSFAILDGADVATVRGGPTQLANPNNRSSNNVSVTRDAAGRGVITWVDASYNNYLYYALIDSSGRILTSPMIFYTAQSGAPQIFTSASGQGNAPYDPTWRIYIPVLNRQ